MKNSNESRLFDEQIYTLEEDLQELLDKSEKILGYKPDSINQAVENLLTLNTNIGDSLAADIISIEEDMIVTDEYYSEEENENPFDTLYDEDVEL